MKTFLTNLLNKLNESLDAFNLRCAVDKLGNLQAKASRLRKEAKILETIVKDSGVSEIKGRNFRCVISPYTRVSVNYRAICDRLDVSDYLVKKHSTHTDAVRVAVKAHKKVSAKKAIGAAAKA